MIRLHSHLTSLLGLALAVLLAGSVHAAQDGRTAPLFDDLGDHHSPITTSVPLAQRYFDQGLILAWGFNHAEAVRSFREAQRLDPGCAMCFWGEAFALGPNINKPMDPADAPAAWAAVQQAQALAAQASPREQALIDALAKRYGPAAVDDRAPLDQAFADAMAMVAAAYPDDLDTLTLYAEAMMDTMPWAYYEENGTPKPLTVTLTSTLETVLARNPDHPGAIHLYIHAVESSDTPERAEGGADRLGDLVPGSGHLVHMPSHIYLRVGRYHDATLTNERAARADESYINQCRAQGFYPALYYPHNIHFLWYTASLEGRSEIAIAAARKLADNVPKDLIGDIPLIEQFLAVPMFGLIRFARWDEVLAEPRPREDHRFATAMWHAARGIAHAARGERDAAMAERAGYLAGAQVYGPDAYKVHGYPADVLLAIAGHVLDAGIAHLDGDADTLVTELEAAVAAEDALPYMEPPYWFFPNRHLLGAALLELDRPAAAEAVYRRDLEKVRKNGWALDGLAQALSAQGRHDEAAAVRAEFEDVWPHADVTLGRAPGSVRYF
jgi:tetratricopeptide (TPR) repeat protein